MREFFLCKLVAVSLLALVMTVGIAQERSPLPDGVIHLSLPPGTVKMETFVRNGKHLLRVTAGKTVIEAKELFFGDFKGATHYEATKNGVHWVCPKGGEGTTFATLVCEPGSSKNDEDFLHVSKLKAGSVYVTTPSLIFRYGADAKQKP